MTRIAWKSPAAASYPLRSPTTESPLWRMPLAFKHANHVPRTVPF